MYVAPEAARFTLTATPQGLQAAIPPRRSWFTILFLLAWMGGWVFGEVQVVADLMNPKDNAPTLFLVAWLAGWTLGGGFALATVLWQLFGRELVTVNAAELVHRVEVLGLGRTRVYDATQIKALRAAAFDTSLTNQQAWMPPLFGAGVGPLVFDYGARTIRMAPSMDEAETQELVRQLAPRLPASLV